MKIELPKLSKLKSKIKQLSRKQPLAAGGVLLVLVIPAVLVGRSLGGRSASASQIAAVRS